MSRAPDRAPTFRGRDGQIGTLRTDRCFRPLTNRGMVLWKKRGYSEWDGLWCIYGCPSSAHELVDHGDITVLWGVCQHPIDLSDGAAERHDAAYAERVRRQIYSDVAEPAESLSEPLEIQRRVEERGSPWTDRLKRLMIRVASRW